MARLIFAKKHVPLFQRFSGFLRSEAASAVVGYAVAMPVVLGFVGVGVDMAMMSMKQTHLQTAADNAAIGSVKELNVANATDATVTASAEQLALTALNDSNVVVRVAVAIDRKSDEVEVTLTENWNPFFAHFIGTAVTPIVVDASAKLAGRSNLCVLALGTTDAKAIYMDKSAKLLANGCAVYSNSSHSQGITLASDSEMTAELVCSAGGVKHKKGAVNPSPTTDCAIINDPLASRLPPHTGICDEEKLIINQGSRTLNPGNYCGGLVITGTAEVKFSEGEYIISDGPFEISKTANVSGENVAFYLEGDAAQLKFSDDTTISLSGAESGAMAGLLFFGDRSLKNVQTHRINSANAKELTGTIYLPRGHLLIDPNASVAQDSAYTAIVAYTLEVNEGPTLTLNSDYSETSVPVPEGVTIGSQVVLAD